MAQEGSEASVASSSPAPNWWEIHTNPISSWNAMNNMNRWQLNPPHHSNSSCEDQDMSNISTTSFNNASNHSGLSMDSSSMVDVAGEPGENHLWSQVLFSVGNGGGDLHNSHNDSKNFLESLSSKTLSTEMLDPACDYLKKFTNQSYNTTMIEPERLTNLSDLVSNWSIAPPNAAFNNVALDPSMSQIKHEILPNSSYPCIGTGYFPPSNSMGYQVGLNNSLIDAPWSNNARNLSDLISFGSSCLNNKPATEFRASSKPSFKGSEDSKKQGHETSSTTKGSGRGGGTSDGKKKRSEDGSETAIIKKSKLENSNASSVKPPKVKLADRITALQQIVSPFGKTDTASVLLEAINYIRILQEQVQLLSDPYLKSNANKDHNSWGSNLERKDHKGEPMLDLRSRGLCLVPISCTPQVYRENSGPDYWPPTYRGCLYR